MVGKLIITHSSPILSLFLVFSLSLFPSLSIGHLFSSSLFLLLFHCYCPLKLQVKGLQLGVFPLFGFIKRQVLILLLYSKTSSLMILVKVIVLLFSLKFHITQFFPRHGIFWLSTFGTFDP